MNKTDNKYQIREEVFEDGHSEYFPEVFVEARHFVAPCDEHWENISELAMRITFSGYDSIKEALNCIESHKKNKIPARTTKLKTIIHEIK